MRYVFLGILMLLGSVMVPVHGVAFSGAGQIITHENTPLMMIRFNQRKVFYERQLYNAISRAFDVKPNATFEVIHYIPAGKNEDQAIRAQNKAQKNMNMMMQSFAEMGVPGNRVSISKEIDRSAKYDEVHIYVR